MQHAVLGSGAVATAVRTVNPSTTGWNGNSIALDMPSFRSFQRELDTMPEVVKFSGDVVKKPGLKIGYLEQNNGLERDSSIIAEMRKVAMAIIRF